MEAKLGFSFDDTDFTDFLPELPEEQFYTRWADFNHHDPGVTTVEALNFSYEDFIYRYNLPIQNILQGKIKNALSSWGIMKLYPQYAVSEDDYRSVLGVYDAVYNAVAIPALKSNTTEGKQKLACLLNINVAVDSFKDVSYWQKKLLKYRAVGEYYNRQTGCENFIKEKVTGVNINATVNYYREKDTVKNRQKLRHTLERYLLPNLKGIDFRYLTKDGLNSNNLQTCFTSISYYESLFISPILLNQPCYRRYIIVAELYEVLLNLPFISSVEFVEIGLIGRPSKSSVLDCGEFTFAKLNRLNVNSKVIKNGVDMELLEATESKLITGIEKDSPSGSYKNLGAFNSLQKSFPPNYEIGVNLENQTPTVLGKTSSFRTFLYFMDQIRADTSAQMGNLSKVFAISKRNCDIATNNVSSNPFYKDLTFNDSDTDFSSTEEAMVFYGLDAVFKDKRLNYLLALNGWSLGREIVTVNQKHKQKKLLEIKNDFLMLIHYGIKNYKVNNNLNRIFRAVSLVMLQQKIKIILQTDVLYVRIFEHCFLQPVWTNDYGLNFELTVFIFPKEDDLYKSEKFSNLANYTEELVRAFVPSQIIPNIRWIQNSNSETDYSLQSFELLLNEAYPPKKIFYFDESISTSQREAMNRILNDWVYCK